MDIGLVLLSFILGCSLAVVTFFSVLRFRWKRRMREATKDPIDPRKIIHAVRNDSFVRTPTQRDRRTVWVILSILILAWILFVARTIGGR